MRRAQSCNQPGCRNQTLNPSGRCHLHDGMAVPIASILPSDTLPPAEPLSSGQAMDELMAVMDIHTEHSSGYAPDLDWVVGTELEGYLRESRWKQGSGYPLVCIVGIADDDDAEAALKSLDRGTHHSVLYVDNDGGIVVECMTAVTQPGGGTLLDAYADEFDGGGIQWDQDVKMFSLDDHGEHPPSRRLVGLCRVMSDKRIKLTYEDVEMILREPRYQDLGDPELSEEDAIKLYRLYA